MAHLQSRSLVEGWITVYALNPRTGEKRDVRRFRNLIVNGGLDLIASATIATTLNKFAVGTGTTAPAPSQTALVTLVAVGGSSYHSTTHTGDATRGVGGTSPHEYGYYKSVLRTGDSTANLNLEEIGWFNSSTVMFNRQRFKNSSGVDTTFTLLIGEQLVAELEVRVYAPTADQTSTLVLNSGLASASTHTVTSRPINITGGQWAFSDRLNEGWRLDASTYYPSASSLTPLVNRDAALFTATSASTVTYTAYVSGNYYIDETATWDPSTYTHNIGRAIWWHGRFQSNFDPVLSKTSLNRLQLTIRHSWSTTTI